MRHFDAWRKTFRQPFNSALENITVPPACIAGAMKQSHKKIVYELCRRSSLSSLSQQCIKD